MLRMTLCTIVFFVSLGVAGAAPVKSDADVYLLRGIVNVFSRGLDEIAESLKIRGIEARVLNHSRWRSVTQEIVANQKAAGRRPVILIGHSLGANRIIDVAQELARRKIRVDYMVTFAATKPDPIPANVRKVTNYYFATKGWGEPIVKGRGFRGNMKNIDFSSSSTIGHFNIDEQPRLQRQVINNVLRILGSRKRAGAVESTTAEADRRS